jgi:hypothetical protein
VTLHELINHDNSLRQIEIRSGVDPCRDDLWPAREDPVNR